ncbi:AMP-binding protein, partial [Frankia sp. Cr1]|uniref:AMP-binding protein n=1 Tax=Frankia sp. Cr1 TaxID=3073931 RepID=UPI002AD4D677
MPRTSENAAGAAQVAAPTCRLPAIVDAMPTKMASTIFCRRDGELVGVPYPDCHRDATIVAAALLARGVRPGDRVAIHGGSSYEWVLADLACLITGAVSVALYPNAPPERVVGTARESRCQLV